jgi:hypothetical protein
MAEVSRRPCIRIWDGLGFLGWVFFTFFSSLHSISFSCYPFTQTRPSIRQNVEYIHGLFLHCKTVTSISDETKMESRELNTLRLKPAFKVEVAFTGSKIHAINDLEVDYSLSTMPNSNPRNPSSTTQLLPSSGVYSASQARPTTSNPGGRLPSVSIASSTNLNVVLITR